MPNHFPEIPPKSPPRSGSLNLDNRSATTLLTAVVGGDGLLPGFTDHWGVFQTYHGHLVLFLFARDGLSGDGEQDDTTLLQKARDSGMLFLEWILATRESTRLYPTKPLCLRNIIDNDIMVLQQGDRLLVRQPAFRRLKAMTDKLKVVSESIEEPMQLYRNTVYQYRPDDFVDLSVVLAEEADLFGLLNKVTQVQFDLCRFRDERAPNDCTGVPNVFVNGYRLALENVTPLMPDSIFGHKLLLCDTGGTIRSYENTVDSSWKILLSIVESSNTKMLTYDHVIQVQAADLRKYILPIDASDAAAEVQFLQMLTSNISNISEETPHSLDRRRFFTMIQFAQWLIDQGSRYGERIPSVVGLGLRNYLSVTKPEGFARQLIFTPINTPSDSNIGLLLSSICSSLEWVERDASMVWGENSPVRLLQSAFSAVDTAIKILKDEKAVDVESINRAMAEAEVNGPGDLHDLNLLEESKFSTGDDNEILLNGIELFPASGTCSDGRNVYVCRFGGFAATADRLRHSHASDLKRTKSYACTSKAGILLVIPDDVIRATYEGIRRRSELWEQRFLQETDQSVVEGLTDGLMALKDLRGHPRFYEAISVVLANHHTSRSIFTRADAERFLIRWLSLFTIEEAETILYVIAAHECITKQDVNNFIRNVRESRDSGHFLLTTKRTDDMGGVQRMFTLTDAGQEIFRTLSLDTAVQRICDADVGSLSGTLTILAENILSGTQLRRALLCHYLAEARAGERFVEGARLHALPVEPAEFRNALNSDFLT